MGKNSRIRKIDNVRLEALADRKDALRAFYGEVVGLESCPDHSDSDGQVCFRASQIHLTIELLESPKLERMADRVRIAVPSLEEVAEQLREDGVAYEWLHGLSSTDQRITLVDPGGNRIALVREWPLLPF